MNVNEWVPVMNSIVFVHGYSASVNGRTGVLYARKFDQNAQN